MTVKTISQSLFERFENEWRQIRTTTPAPAKPVPASAK
ncbi:hypothetical protein C8J38_101951 [Rhizobium sp. PP-WC-2G-219]|nr:hypothetical protein C8J32_101649 [Rhizobium sp. PP-CC-3A-592]PYE46248.1 hypothetical protein DFI02_101388 [Rhizobium sp. PP-F2F-G20b]TCL96590.1 hypothetical protein C8J38_101951 [Rhizobium sp. PP-WC-2G-219]